MPLHRHSFPDLDAPLLITDGGLETTLVFDQGFDLPHFASFPLVDDIEGRAALARYFRTYTDLARRHGAGLLIDTPTWRANPDWGARLGYEADGLAAANRRAVDLWDALRGELPPGQPPVAIGGSVGPRADGYVPGERMSPEAAERYHSVQLEVLADTPIDFVSALTFNYVDEAVGVARAAARLDLPLVLSFTVELDGRLPTGESLGLAVETVDAATDASPAYYMVNCAHPEHYADAITGGEPWTARLGGLRSNASTLSHAELDEATELDGGDPQRLAAHTAELARALPTLRVFGGCCGTDERHLGAMAAALGR